MEALPWLGLLMLVATTSGKGVLDLSGKQVVNGTWKAAVTLPCVYKPSADFKELHVTWKSSLQDHGLRTIFQRDENSGDQTLLTVFKGRLSVRSQPPGDVSLQIKGLDMTDTGLYTCSVQWEARNKTRITKERVTRLRVIKVPVTKPVITSGSGASPILPEGARTSLTCQAEGSPPIRFRWFKEVAGSKDQLMGSEAALTFDHLTMADAGSYYCVVENRVTTRKEQSETVQLIVEEDAGTTLPTFGSHGNTWQGSTESPRTEPGEQTTTRQDAGTTLPTFGSHGNTWQGSTESPRTEPGEQTTTRQGDNKNKSPSAATSQQPKASPGAGVTSSTFGPLGNAFDKQGSRKAGLPLHIIILIAVLCAILVLVVLSVAFCRRKTQSGQAYQVAYNNNATDFTAEDRGAGGAFRVCEGIYEEPSPCCVENNYTEEPTKGSDYVTMGVKPGNEYEFLVSKMESEYEVTNNM